MWPKIWTPVAFSVVLAACQSTGCPPLVKYSAAQQQRAAQELRKLGKSPSQIAQMIVDYKKTRDACRASGVW